LESFFSDTFLSLLFLGYVSGHSTISAGCAEALKLWTGSEEFGQSVELVAGSMTEPNHLGKKSNTNVSLLLQRQPIWLNVKSYGWLSHSIG
jgi:hypothetical protein